MARSSPRSRVEDYYNRVADSLIRQIERGTAPWTQAWQPGEKTMPCNVKTGKAYRGGNSVWLMSVAERRGYADERWGTFKQVQELKGQVRRGEKGTRILYWHFEERRLAKDRSGLPVLDSKGNPVFQTRALPAPRAYTYTVFNAEQCQGLPQRPTKREWDGHEGADQLIQRTGARIEHSGEDRAFYDIRGDRVVLPYKERFESAPGYYQAALHELGHWTGHASRLNRATLQEGIAEGPYSKQYAREELRAEISSMMTGDRLNLGHDPSRNASYVNHWIKALRDDSREIYRASRDAQDISDYLIEPERDRVAEREARMAAIEREGPRDGRTVLTGREASPMEGRDADVPLYDRSTVPRPSRPIERVRVDWPNR